MHNIGCYWVLGDISFLSNVSMAGVLYTIQEKGKRAMHNIGCYWVLGDISFLSNVSMAGVLYTTVSHTKQHSMDVYL